MKNFKRLLAVLLVGMTLISSISALAIENTEIGLGGRDVFSNVTTPLIEITDTYLEVYETQGGVKLNDFSNIPKDSYINISYAFRILDLFDDLGEDGQVKEGDYFSISIPNELAGVMEFEEIVDQILQVSFDGENYDIAKLNVTKNEGVKITFLKDVESLSDVTVHFSLGGYLQPDKIDDEDTIAFSLVASGTVYTIGFIPDEPETPITQAAIEKNGVYSEETNEITWTITVDSGDPNVTISNVIVKDILGDNQTFMVGSTLPLVFEPTVDTSENVCTFLLSEVTGTTSITYKTRPTKDAYSTIEGGTSTVTNQAELYYGNEPNKKDDTEANVLLTTNWIEKSGVARIEEGTTYIDWTIGLNYNHQTIPKDTIVSDNLPTYLILDETSVQRNGIFYETQGDTITVSGQNLSYQFGADVTGEQKITFTTRVDAAYYQQQFVKSFANTAIVSIDGVAYEDTSEGIGVSTNLLNKYGEGYDASTGRITWKLNVNENGLVFTNATILDSITSDQLLDEDYGVMDANGVALIRVSDLSSLKAVPNQYYYQDGELQIYLGDLGALDKPILYFKTIVTNPSDFANNKTTNYSNQAVLTGNGILDSSTTGSQSVKSQVISKENVGYDYTSRLLSWKITINHNNMVLPNVIVTDQIPLGQAIVLESIEIDGKKPKENQITMESNNIIFSLGEVTTESTITFQTKVTDLNIFLDTNGSVTFQNTALLESGIIGAPKVSVSASKIVNNQSISKGILTEYIKENGYIEWEVYANANQAPIKNAVLNDVLQEGLELDTDSVILYQWNQDATGTRTIGNEISLDEYTFTYDYDTRTFQLHLPDGEQGYYLKFKTDVLKPGKYSNSISFGGDYTGADSEASSYYVTNSDLSAAVSGTNGSITVYKTNEAGKIISSGAEFELLDSKHNVIKTQTTDVNGSLTFEKLKLRTYYVREKTAPIGYQKSDVEHKIIISGSTDEAKNPSVTIQNSLLTGNILLKKVNQDGDGLAGGTFSIYEESDSTFSNPIATVMSKEGGLISFQGIKAGSYVIKEVKAPAGYQLAQEVRKAVLSVDNSNNSIQDITVNEAFVNEAIPSVKFGTAKLFKSDESNHALQGAEFGLYDTNDSMIQTAVSKEDGSVIFTNVPYGTYTIREIQAPKGYEKSKQISTVSIKDSVTTAKATPFTIVNKALKDSGTDNNSTDTDNTDKKKKETEIGGAGILRYDASQQNEENDYKTNQATNANTLSNEQNKNRLIKAGDFWDEITLYSVAAISIFSGLLLQYLRRRKKV